MLGRPLARRHQQPDAAAATIVRVPLPNREKHLHEQEIVQRRAGLAGKPSERRHLLVVETHFGQPEERAGILVTALSPDRCQHRGAEGERLCEPPCQRRSVGHSPAGGTGFGTPHVAVAERLRIEQPYRLGMALPGDELGVRSEEVAQELGRRDTVEGGVVKMEDEVRPVRPPGAYDSKARLP